MGLLEIKEEKNRETQSEATPRNEWSEKNAKKYFTVNKNFHLMASHIHSFHSLFLWLLLLLLLFNVATTCGYAKAYMSGGHNRRMQVNWLYRLFSIIMTPITIWLPEKRSESPFHWHFIFNRSYTYDVSAVCAAAAAAATASVIVFMYLFYSVYSRVLSLKTTL